ncbi:hypothetical protein D3C74_480020 [compost metagenome]
MVAAHVLTQPFLMDSRLLLFLINLSFQIGNTPPMAFCKKVTAIMFILKPRHITVYLI